MKKLDFDETELVGEWFFDGANVESKALVPAINITQYLFLD